MEINKNGHIKNWSLEIGQRPKGYGIEVTNFDYRGKQGNFDLADLDPSLYFVSISSNLGQKSYHKIIKI